MKREVATPAVTPGSGRARERAYATLGPCAVRAAGAAPGKWAEYRRNAALPSVSIRELKVDAARFGIDARGMEKAELAAAVDAARAASEARKLERPAKKRKTERKPPQLTTEEKVERRQQRRAGQDAARHRRDRIGPAVQPQEQPAARCDAEWAPWAHHEN